MAYGQFSAPFPGTSKSTHDITSGDSREWGADYPLKAGTPIYAFFDGIIGGYSASGTDWAPGMLTLTGGPNGAAAGYGHVISTLKIGTHVSAGQQIGVVGNQGANSHLEFMLFPNGKISHASAIDPRGYISTLQGLGGTAFTSGPLQSGSVGEAIMSFAVQATGVGAGAVTGAPAPCRKLSETTAGAIAGIGNLSGFLDWASQPCVYKRTALFLVAGGLILFGLKYIGAPGAAQVLSAPGRVVRAV